MPSTSTAKPVRNHGRVSASDHPCRRHGGHEGCGTGGGGATRTRRATGDWTPYYAPHGAATARQAAEDLVAELRRHGYHLAEGECGLAVHLARPGALTGSSNATKYCQMTIALDETGKSVEVELTP
jgi:hypothetical protein